MAKIYGVYAHDRDIGDYLMEGIFYTDYRTAEIIKEGYEYNDALAIAEKRKDLFAIYNEPLYYDIHEYDLID